VLGAGVAGLQAIATARRLGAIVSATDVRKAAGEQVESLGAKFVFIDLKDGEGGGGYARALTPEEQQQQAALVSNHIKNQDIVITTALIPGRPAPRLITRAMVDSMKPGSVIVDLAAEAGGNCELTKADEIVHHGNVTIIGFTDLASRIAVDSSALYARNLLAFLTPLVDKETKSLNPKWDDEIVRGTLLARDGKIVHASFAPPSQAEPPTSPPSSPPTDTPTSPPTGAPTGTPAAPGASRSPGASASVAPNDEMTIQPQRRPSSS
ncbi:MAG: Re/Si-specific NAD(P)(+) transhydrogenase subunit alpha, partial [Alphaproteobacteria bacterium]